MFRVQEVVSPGEGRVEASGEGGLLSPLLIFALYRLEEALSDCIWAQKHMRGNTVIDYRQLGLRFKLYSWQVEQPPSTSTSVPLFLHSINIEQ